MEEKNKFIENFVHLARIALSGRDEDVHKFLYRIAKRNTTDPALANALVDLLRKRPTQASPLRRTTEMAVPVDAESRFQLLRVEERPDLPHKPIYARGIQETLTRLIKERQNLSALIKAGLEPTKTVLFTGPPGVGKTLAARWTARELKWPLLTLDLSAVMNSYLGRTGSNLKYVLDYAKSIDCVLLLDELDAIAKRRNDFGEIGELKRLVTVLLQQLDDWPPTSILLAATNHAELLDPAIWRRFEELIEFPLPEREQAESFIKTLLYRVTPKADEWSKVLSIALAQQSFNDIERKVNGARREAAINNRDVCEHLSPLLKIGNEPKRDRINLAVQLVSTGLVSQRRAHELTGVARDTIRDRLKNTTTTELE